MDVNSNSKDPPANKNIGPCKVCGTVATTYCYGVPTCTECRKFFHDNRKKESVGCCLNQMRCFIGKTKKGYWDETSNCKTCRFERMVFLGMMELQGMKGLGKSIFPFPIPKNKIAPIPSEFVARSATLTATQPAKTSSPKNNGDSTFRTTTSTKRCQICFNDKQVANAYGARAICLTCSQYFFRCWKDENKLPVQCHLNQGNIGECDTSRYHPPICRFCRLKKCIELGMKCSFPLTRRSAVAEVMQLLQGYAESDVLDGPGLEDDRPLFSAKAEDEQEDQSVSSIMSPKYISAPPPTPLMSPARTEEMNCEAPECSTSSTQPSFVPLRYSCEYLCCVCVTYPIVSSTNKFCGPCQMFFGYACQNVGVFKSICYAKDCDLKGDPSRCSLCRLLRCLRFGLNVHPRAIVPGSPLHRAMLQMKNTPVAWQWLGGDKPRQLLPKHLEDGASIHELVDEQERICAVGKRNCEELFEVGQGIRVCTKCKEFFTYCNEERKYTPAVCANGGESTIDCLSTPCTPCKLIRCLEVGMCAPWKQGTLLYNTVKAWRPKAVPLVNYKINMCPCGREIEDEATGETCLECTSQSLLQHIRKQIANGEEKGGTHFELLYKAGLADRVAKRRSFNKEHFSLNSVNATETASSTVDSVLPSGEIIPIEIIRVGAAQQEAAPVANGDHSATLPPAAPPPQNLNSNQENRHQLSENLVPNGVNRKRKSTATRDSNGTAFCEVCSIEFTSKQKYYNCSACTSCSNFFHRCFKEEEHFFCLRKKGDDPCNIQQTTWQHRGAKPCSWCRLVKWISLSPRLPSAPLKGTPIHQMIYQEQVAVLTDENESRRGSYRLEPIEDNLKLSASRTFQLVESSGQRTEFVSSDEEEEGSTGSMASGSSRENRCLTNTIESPSISLEKRDAKSPCSVCGTLRRPPEKKLGGSPACVKCKTLITGCWKNVNGPARCLQLNGEHGKCNLSWKYRQCVYCQIMRAIVVGCVPLEKPVRGSMGEMMMEEHRKHGHQNDAAESDTTDEEEDVNTSESSKRARWSEECVGCGNDNTQSHYGVKMCPACHSFFRHNMKVTASFIPCLCQNNSMGKCPINANIGLKNCCGYCRLKNLIAPGILLCKENIEYTPVKMMIDIEKIEVKYVSGGSYATKSSMLQVSNEMCKVCTHFGATSHFHGVFLCRKCRAFITKQWANSHDLNCLNPTDPSKCAALVAQQCGLCRIIKCIEVGARSNGPPLENSFIRRLCPGYPEKKEIDEQVLERLLERSRCRVATVAPPTTFDRLKALGELPPLIDFKIEGAEKSPVSERNGHAEQNNGELAMEIGAMMIDEARNAAEEENVEENEESMDVDEVEENQESGDVEERSNGDKGTEEDVEKEEDDTTGLLHFFDKDKTMTQKCSEFLTCFEEVLVSVKISSRKRGMEPMNQLNGWNTFIVGVEPVFEAFCKWADTLQWFLLFDDVNREQILRDSCVEAAVLISCQIMKTKGCIPYGADQVLYFEDLQTLLRNNDCTDELAALDKFYECFKLVEEIDFIRRDLALIMNVILVKRTGYGRYVLDQYFKQIEEMLISESLEEEAPMEKVRTLIDTLLDTGDVIRLALMKLSKLPFAFLPMTKRFFCCTD